MLTPFSLTSKDSDPQKQLASMRSYLAILKDEIEGELSNIRYDMLDADLRARLDDITGAVAYAQNTADAVMGTLKAKYITADEISSNYVTANYLTANYITANQISANYASYNWVYALNGVVENLEAKAITVDNLSAQTIYGSQISGLTISASQITSGQISTSRIDFSTGISSALAVNETILVGFARYSAGTSDRYIELNRNGIVFNYRGHSSVTWQWEDAFNNK